MDDTRDEVEILEGIESRIDTVLDLLRQIVENMPKAAPIPIEAVRDHGEQ